MKSMPDASRGAMEAALDEHELLAAMIRGDVCPGCHRQLEPDARMIMPNDFEPEFGSKTFRTCCTE